MFSGITGHERPLRFLSRVIQSNRLGHAYLFSGPEGIGKATVARAMAAGLLCTDPQKSVPCGHCPGCLQFVSGNHPDFLHIAPEGASIKIDRIRSLKRQLAFAPFSGGLRIILLEEVQSLRREAGNSLLKLLEEPPPDNLFFLVASDNEPVLPTILSRCQVVSFAPLAYPLAADVIRRQNPELEHDQALKLARITEGSPGRALAIEAGEALALFARVAAALADPHLSGAAAVEEALFLAAEMAALQEELPLLFGLLKTLFKEALLLGLGKESVATGVETGIKEAGRIRERWNLSRLSDKMDAVDYAEKALAGNCNRGLVCDVLMVRLMTGCEPLRSVG
ncbi:MAG: DNA polymerase III subunit delta' [Desulfobulbus sp.]|nr:MAG: DNA polymerase III subunit delta' [Desulfobulbus sp.]